MARACAGPGPGGVARGGHGTASTPSGEAARGERERARATGDRLGGREHGRGGRRGGQHGRERGHGPWMAGATRGGAVAVAVPWLRSGREREEERKEGRAHT